jgi:hypothetical protein
MFYVVLNGQPGSQGKAYHFYKFKSENAAKKCARTDDFSLAFESADGLEVVCSADDIKGVLTASGVEVPETATKSQMANALFLLVSENATSWSGKNDETTQTEEPDMATAKKAKKSAAKKPKAEKVAKVKAPKKVQAKAPGRMSKTGKIKKLGTNPAREGTKRYENLEVVLQSKTVESALETLRNMTPPGGMLDIRFALESGLIEISGND